MTTGGSSIYWDDGTCRQRIINTDDSTANTAVFNFQQSENSGSSWKNLLEIRDNGRLVLTNKTGGIYRVDDGATNEPLIHLSNNNVDSSIMRIDGNGRTSVVNTQSHGFDLKYIGTGEGENNSLDLIADNMDGANVTAISVSNNGKIGIGDKFNTNYRLYVNGNSYLKGNNFLYGDLSAFYDGVDQYLQYTAEGTVANHAAKISLYRIIASGKAGTAGTKVPGVQLDAATGMLHLQAAASDPSASAGARIKFTYWNAADSNGQPVYISHSVNDSYRAPYGLKIWGSDGTAPGAWLEVEGNLYIGSASNSNSNDNAALYIRGMSAIEGYDTWLRLNDNSSFSSGTLSPKLIRSDEALQVGSGGTNFYANSSGNGYIQNTFGVHGTDTTKHFFVNGTSRFADDITMDNGSEILFSTNTQYLRWTTNTGDNNSTGRSWYGIGTYQNTSNGNNSWLNISNYWGINITTKRNICLRHNNNVITTTGNQTGTVGSGTHPIYSSEGVLMASSSTVGSEVKGIYLNAGAITPMSYELKATVNSGTANRVSYYNGSNQISSANSLYTTGGNLGINATTTTVNSVNHTLYVNGTSYIQSAAANSTTAGLTVKNGLINIVNYGYTLTLGNQNSGCTHIQTSCDKFYFNKAITVDGYLYPYTDNTRNLGTSSNRWANAYATTFHGYLDGNAATATKATQDSSGQQINTTYIKNVKLVSGANPSYEFTRGDNTTFRINVPNVLSGFTANRLIYSSSATEIRSTSHYADTTSVAINSTSAPASTYNLYVNGGVNLNDALYSDKIVTASSSTVTDITASNASTYFTVTNDATYYFTNPGSFTEVTVTPTGTATTMTLGTVGSYFTFTNDATYPWYMDGNYWRPKNVKDANGEYHSTDSKITLVNGSTAVALKLSYDMKTESSNYDYIYIKVNNVQVGSHWGGTTSGNFTFEVPANATVEIHYRKDGSGNPSDEYVKILLEIYPGYTTQSVTTTLQGWTPTNITNTKTIAKTTFKAKNNCVLTFTITYNKDSSDYFYIYRNGTREYSLSSSATTDTTTTKTLQVFANDIIETRFVRSTNTASTYKHYAYFTLGYQQGSASKQNRSTYSFKITSTTDSTSTTTGALIVSGGIGCAKTIRATKVYGAVWNDYAEYRHTQQDIQPGRCVIETGSGDLVMSMERLQPGANIVSDTFGFAIGETCDTKTPLAVSGRVLAYPYEEQSAYQAGDPVCSGPNGTISKMTREEVQAYPERIVGTVSEIPEYETWGTGNVKVNGRIWIKVR